MAATSAAMEDNGRPEYLIPVNLSVLIGLGLLVQIQRGYFCVADYLFEDLPSHPFLTISSYYYNTADNL